MKIMTRHLESLFLFLVTLTLACRLTLCQPANGRALVLVDSLTTRETHSQVLKQLTNLGLQVTLRTADDPSLQLVRYGQHVYDHVLLFSPYVQEFGGAINIRALLDFVDAGGNLLITGNDRTAESVREVAVELGVEFDSEHRLVIDHLNYDRRIDNGSHSALTVPSNLLVDSKAIVGSVDPESHILYRGTALFTSKPNPLLIKVLSAPASAYSFIPFEAVTEAPNAIGSSGMLVAAIQTRNNARVVVSGSLELFSDDFRDENAPNQIVTNSLLTWLTKRSGVLRVKSLRHGLLSNYKNQLLNFDVEQEKATYTIGDELLVQAVVEELQSDGKWTSYQGKDVQVELRRVDPYVRVTLQTRADGRLSAQLQLPDVCGVYTLVLKHKRIGNTYLSTQQQFSVRPLEHTQYERFIASATPYYASAFSMMIGVFLFSIVFLYHRTPSTKQKTN